MPCQRVVEFLAAMADQSGPVELRTICQRLGRSQQQVSPMRAWLINNGYLVATDYGKLELAHLGLRAVISTDPTLAAQVAEIAPKMRTLPAVAGRQIDAPRSRRNPGKDL